MSKYKDEFNFKLSKPIQYQAKVNGENVFKDCGELLLKAPCLKHHYKIGNVLQALITPAIFKAQKTIVDMSKGYDKETIEKEKLKIKKLKEEKKDDDNEDKEVNKLIMTHSILALGKEINDFYDYFENLFLSEGICFLDNNKPLTDFEFNKLDYLDFKKMVLEYTVNFFSASWMKSLGGN